MKRLALSLVAASSPGCLAWEIVSHNDSVSTLDPPACIDDGFAGNDSRSTAAALTEATELVATGVEYYRFDLPSRHTLELDVTYEGTQDLDLELTRGALQVDSSWGFGGEADVTYTNFDDQPVQLTVKVEAEPGVTCLPYTLTPRFEAMPSCSEPDPYEPDADEEQDSALGDEGIRDAWVSELDSDVFSISVAPLERILLLPTTEGYLDITLVDDEGQRLDQSWGSDFMSWQNTDTVARTVYVEVRDGGLGCLWYDMDVLRSPGVCPEDDPYEPNDTLAERREMPDEELWVDASSPDCFEVQAAADNSQFIDAYSLEGGVSLSLYDEEGVLVDEDPYHLDRAPWVWVPSGPPRAYTVCVTAAWCTGYWLSD